MNKLDDRTVDLFAGIAILVAVAISAAAVIVAVVR